MAQRTYTKIDDETFEEIEATAETTTRRLDRAELQTKVDHWKRDQVNLQKETDDKLADLQADIDRTEAILNTR